MGYPTHLLQPVLRRLSRSPSFTVLSILTLAIGTGATTSVFSIVSAVLIRPLPFPDAQELYGLWHSAPGMNIPQFEQSNETYKAYRELNRSFVDIGLSRTITTNLGSGGEPVRLQSASATSSLFGVLAVRPELGRVFSEEDENIGGPQVVVLGYKLWRGRFGGEPGVIGQTIHLDGTPWEVIGVMPAGFTYPGEQTQLWIPHRIDPESLGLLNFNFEAVGRLKPGITPEAAAADLNQILYRLPEMYPQMLTQGLLEKAQMSAHVNPLRQDVVGDVGQVLWILLGSVSFLLLIACANVANLFLVRAEARRREIALRIALGASGRHLVREFLTESLVLSAAAGVIGLGLSYVGIRTLPFVSPENIPRLSEVRVDGMVLVFVAAVSALVGFALGFLAFLRHGRLNIATAIHEGGSRGSRGRRFHRARNLLVVAQMALALILLIGAGLMARSFRELRRVDPGFDTDGILTLRLSLPESEYLTAEDTARFYQQLTEDLRSLPGVVAVGAISNLPLTDEESNDGLFFEDFPLQGDDLPPVIRTNFVSPGYFEAMGIPLREGRAIERRDHEGATGAVVVSAGLAERFWPAQSAVGKRLGPGRGRANRYTIVGVVGDVRDDGKGRPPVDMIYYPMVGREEGDEAYVVRAMSLAIRTQGPPSDLARAGRETIWALNPRLPVANVRTMSEVASESVARTAYTMLLLALAAGIALLLGTIGIYAVVSYVVSHRTREIGVRMALGARGHDVGRMVVRQGALLLTAGLALGLMGARALTGLLSALLYGVSSSDPLTFVVVSLVLLAVGATASYIPARRAASIDPVEALRHE